MLDVEEGVEYDGEQEQASSSFAIRGTFLSFAHVGNVRVLIMQGPSKVAQVYL